MQIKPRRFSAACSVPRGPYRRVTVFATDERCAGTMRVTRLGRKKKKKDAQTRPCFARRLTVSGQFVDPPRYLKEVAGGIKGVDPAPALIAGGEKNISVVSAFSSDSLSWIHTPRTTTTTNTTASPSHPFQSEVRKKHGILQHLRF